MTLHQAIIILEKHQLYRIGEIDVMQLPREITEATNIILAAVKTDKCICTTDERRGETQLWCCNECGKPIQSF